MLQNITNKYNKDNISEFANRNDVKKCADKDRNIILY